MLVFTMPALCSFTKAKAVRSSRLSDQGRNLYSVLGETRKGSKL